MSRFLVAIEVVRHTFKNIVLYTQADPGGAPGGPMIVMHNTLNVLTFSLEIYFCSLILIAILQERAKMQQPSTPLIKQKGINNVCMLQGQILHLGNQQTSTLVCSKMARQTRQWTG